MVEIIEEKKEEAIKESFISSLKKEAKKISWPTRKSLKSNMKLVVISVFIFGLGIYCADLFVNKAVSVLNSVVFRLIG